MSQITVDDIVMACEAEPASVRRHAAFTYGVLKAICPRALVTQKSLAKNYVSNKASQVYEYASTDDELDALRVGLLRVYEFQHAMHPELVPPHQLFPIKRERTVINEKNPFFGLQYALNAHLSASLNRLHSLEALEQTLVLLLELARRTGITQLSSLETVLGANFELLLPDAQCASVELGQNNRVLLDATALRLLQKLRNRPTRKVLNRFTKIFRRWGESQVQLLTTAKLSMPSPSQVLDALSFATRPIARQAFDESATMLTKTSFIQAVTGRNIEEQEQKPALRRRKRHVREFKQFAQIAALLSSLPERPIALATSSRSRDIQLLNTIYDTLSEFETKQPNQSRASAAFKRLTEQLFDLVDQSAANPHISHVAMLIALYAVDLTLHGSNTKPKLRMSTIKSYLSRLKTLALNVFADAPLLEAAQMNIATLEEQTLFLADYIGDVQSASEQSTIVNFLQYLHQTTEVKFFDADTLEYEGVCDAVIRAHYVAPQLFDATCYAFTHFIDNAERRQYLIFADLCYSLGLRRREAQQLELEDVRFEADDIIVTRYLQRKTKRAIRRARMSFLSIANRIVLENYIHERKLSGHKSVFDAHVLAALEQEFLETLRAQTNQSDLVIHSLRHCAANNMLFQLSMSCVKSLQTARNQYYFLVHERFSDEQLQIIAADIENAGRELTPYFPILDTLAYLMGHVSPATTAQSYLHLLDLLFFELNDARHEVLEMDTFLSLVAQNNYRFVHQARYAKHLKNSERDAADYVFRAFTRAADDIAITNVHPTKNQTSNSRPALSFSDYLAQLARYQSQAADAFDAMGLLEHFRSCHLHLDLHFYHDIPARNYTSWLTLFERLSTLETNAKNLNALRALQKAHQTTEIRDMRSLRKCLRAFQLLGHKGLTFSLSTPMNNAPQVGAWQQAVEAHHYQLQVQVHDEHSPLRMYVKPRYLRWAPWQYLPQVIDVFETYLSFSQSTLPTTSRSL